MTELMTRIVNDNTTAVCLLKGDGYYTVSVNKESYYESYEHKFDCLFEAYDFFDWALENE